ncbi:MULTISPECIES: hypothetical protein [Clostridium]|uniref:hypothetical protein n=1 Tax=Clostridium TaxID=1485 RepID=UPI0015E166E1|nr:MULTISPECIES: hypothetical protein [Clostridium]MBN7576035.1 hypothetical protein [Clostridium beijerinckii]MBN7581132.1 hypothetical protein [Clostridium beijerinckii]MBN7585756.1 hypothetical protein [Clostridium beijerinckii]MBO0521545.1 hypothetical protein [Clostridium beijerinckii]
MLMIKDYLEESLKNLHIAEGLNIKENLLTQDKVNKLLEIEKQLRELINEK